MFRIDAPTAADRLNMIREEPVNVVKGAGRAP